MYATVPPVLATYRNADPWSEIDPSTITLHVPEGSVAAYQASSLWNQFNIEGMTLGVSSESIPSKRYIGDVNNDGNISVEEVARLAELVAEKREYDPRRYDVTGDGLFTIGDMAIITSKLPGGPSEWISSNGTHDYVDLDLPSGTLWATCNVGAASPSEVGCAFAWGETATKHFYFEENYFDTDDLCKTTFKYSSYSGDGLKTELDPEDDAATVLWGNMWQTPSNDQLQELLECATWTPVDEPVKGYWVKSKKDDAKRIFLPKAKYAYAVSRELMSVDGEFLPGTLALYRRIEPMWRFVELPVRPVLKYSSNQ